MRDNDYIMGCWENNGIIGCICIYIYIYVVISGFILRFILGLY